MNVVLTKEIALKSAIIYLKLQKQIKRKEIQSYLQGKRFNNPIVENRVREYLKSISIYDEQYHSTPYGNEVKETGMVDVMEEGEYKIYFTQDDSYFGNTIFFLQRQCPQFNQQPNFKSFSFDNKVEHFCLSPIKDKPFRFFLEEFNHGIEIPSTTSITFFWKWKELESSVYTFKGKIENNVIDDKAEFKINKDLHECITEILPDWDSVTTRYKIQFGSTTDIDRTSFECSYDNKQGYFNVHIDKLPIEPYNLDEARLWRNHLLDVKLSENYLNPKDFENVVRKINQKKGFIAYENSLDVPTTEEYLKEINRKVDIKAYWHLAAPLDLNPGIPKAMIKQVFSYPAGKIISFQEIAKEICGNTVEKIFYYDKYVITRRQQEYLCAFFEAFSYNKAYLITDTAKTDRDDYIEKQRNNIMQKNLRTIFKNTKPQHDRYLIISVGTELKVLNVSNSIDYIQFKENKENIVSAYTKGHIEQSVVFTNVEETMLDTELLQFIKEEIKNV